MSKLVLRSLSLTTGQILPVNEVASFFMLVSNTGALKIQISIDNDPFSDFPVGYEYREKGDEHFKKITFKNPNAGTVVIEYIMSTGLVRSSPAMIALSDILEEMQGVSTGAAYDTEKNIGVAAGQVFAVNAARHSASCQSKSTNSDKIYLGYDANVLTTKWIAELQPGQSWATDDWRGTIYAIATAADQKLGFGEH